MLPWQIATVFIELLPAAHDIFLLQSAKYRVKCYTYRGHQYHSFIRFSQWERIASYKQYTITLLFLQVLHSR